MEWAVLISQLLLTAALFGATFWYAYHTRRLAYQQRLQYLLNREIWESNNTPRIWFFFSQPETSELTLYAYNYGRVIINNISVQITGGIGKFEWTWPSIIPEGRIRVYLPPELSLVSKLNEIDTINIKCVFHDIDEKEFAHVQSIKCMELSK